MSSDENAAPRVLRDPATDARETSAVGRYLRWLESERGLRFDDYDALQRWSVTGIGSFWQTMWDYFGVVSDTDPGPALASRAMPGSRWFPTAQVNWARHVLVDSWAEDWPAAGGAAPDDSGVAVVAYSQTREEIELTWAELRSEVARTRVGLQRLGVGRGDRVAAYLPNIPETLVAYLACASLGAIFASCAPEFGPRSVVDRFGQIEPVVLLAVSGYRYGDKDVDRAAEAAEIAAALPSVQHVVHVPYGPWDALECATSTWSELRAEEASLEFDPVPFDHPLCILFSSGTTGKPKPIVHCHGGLILEHCKDHSFCWDVLPGDRVLWFSTTAWMVWNAVMSILLQRASVVLIDGNPLFPRLDWQWDLVAQSGATVMGASPGWLMACRKEGIAPTDGRDLSGLRGIMVAGAPLPTEGFEWVYEQFGEPLYLNVTSGGTDVCSGMTGSSPLLPVWAGEMSGRLLGVATDAYDPEGHSVVGELGEMVITEPMPSMPVGFWGDADGERYRSSYFDMYPGVWRQGDWIRFTERGSCVVTGRSDATLNRGGVRLGTSEFYALVEDFPEVVDSLVVHLEDPEGGNGELILYLVLREGVVDDGTLAVRVRREIRESLSPRHVPDEVLVVPSIPRSRTGKKLEVPVKRILQGSAAEDVASRDALVDGSSLDAYVAHAARRREAQHD